MAANRGLYGLPLTSRRGLFGLPLQLGDITQAFWPCGTDDDFTTVASSVPTTVSPTTAATAHTMGAWVEVVAATTVDHYGLLITPGATSASGLDTSTLLDVGVGVAASESVVVPFVCVGASPGSGAFGVLHVPVFIRAGSRVAVRAQSVRVSTAIPVQIAGVYGANGEQPAEFSDAIGVNAGASTGTVVATPGGPNTLGAWTELSASTTRTYRAVVVNFSPSATGGLSNGNGLLDVGVGGSGAEVVVATRLPYSQTSAEAIIRSAMQRVIPGPFPAGSRFAARYQATNTTQAPCMSLIGIPA